MSFNTIQSLATPLAPNAYFPLSSNETVQHWARIALAILQKRVFRSLYHLYSIKAKSSHDIVSFWFWGYRCDIRIELQAPVAILIKTPQRKTHPDTLTFSTILSIATLASQQHCLSPLSSVFISHPAGSSPSLYNSEHGSQMVCSALGGLAALWFRHTIVIVSCVLSRTIVIIRNTKDTQSCFPFWNQNLIDPIKSNGISHSYQLDPFPF